MNNSTLLNCLVTLFSDTTSEYTDVLLQEDKPMMIFTPAGWTDMGIKSDSVAIRSFAMDLLHCKDEDALVDRLATGGACNMACTIERTHVRVDISLVSDQGMSHATMVGDPSMSVQRPVIEMVIRRHRAVQPLENLHFPQHLTEQLAYRNGLILVTGPSGAGKTSSCNSMLGWINTNTNSHIITIQDPIEGYQENINSVFSNKEVGRDVPSFEVAVYNALRQKPDVIFISELRDAETCRQALLAAQSALVIATTHAPNMEDGLTRLLNFFPKEELQYCRMLKSSLRCVISQALLPVDQRNKWAMFYEYVQGNNMILQESLSSGGDFSGLRNAMADRAVRDTQRATGALDSRLLGLVPMNGALARAIESKSVVKEDAYRASPDERNLTDVLTRLTDMASANVPIQKTAAA